MNIIALIFTVCTVSYTVAAPDTRTLSAVQHEEFQDSMGQYTLRYVTANGTIIVVENGHIISTPDGKGKVMIMDGQVSYVGDDGKMYVTKYTAGPGGFQAEGDHLPVTTIPTPVKLTTK